MSFKVGVGKSNFAKLRNDGNYYVGQFKRGYQCGEGKEYDKDGKLIYEGKYINGKRDKCAIF